MTSQVDYTANGSIVAFPYPFAIPAKSALEVRINDVIQDVGFVITGAGSADGGNVVFGNAPAEGLAISLRYLGAVTITAQDATAGHLSDKLIAGAGISLETVTEAGGMQRLKLNADEAADALEKDRNLADLTDAAEARTNLGVYSKAEVDSRITTLANDVAALSTAMGARTRYLHVQDQKTSGTAGGSITAGAWITRELNTVIGNTIIGAALSDNQVTLPAGTYRCFITVPGYALGGGGHAGRLYNVSGAVILRGGNALAYGGEEHQQEYSTIVGQFILTTTTVLEVHQITKYGETAAGQGRGRAKSIVGEVEIYTDAVFWKVE